MANVKETTKTATTTDDGFQDVDLFRKYVRLDHDKHAEKGWPQAIKVLALACSGDVRELYKQERKQGDKEPGPCYVWAFQLLEDVPDCGILSVGEGQPCKGEKGEVVYMFEPSALGQFLRAHHGDSTPVSLQSLGKKSTKHAEYGTIYAWQWKCRANPNPMKTLPAPGGQAMINLPSLVAAPALPTSADFSKAEREAPNPL